MPNYRRAVHEAAVRLDARRGAAVMFNLANSSRRCSFPIDSNLEAFVGCCQRPCGLDAIRLQTQRALTVTRKGGVRRGRYRSVIILIAAPPRPAAGRSVVHARDRRQRGRDRVRRAPRLRRATSSPDAFAAWSSPRNGSRPAASTACQYPSDEMASAARTLSMRLRLSGLDRARGEFIGMRP